ncbi:hypothetical protein N9917_02365 [Deltaproteobacteria bacterium]|nr:hypothetical protein [Deltaproteobacteria bacterium]
MADPVAPSRDKLKALFPNHDDLVAFERLFEVAGGSTPDDLESLAISVGLVGGQAVQALDAINRMANALELLSLAPQQDVSLPDLIEPPRENQSIDQNIVPTPNPVRVVESDLTVKGNLELPKGPGIGLKVDVVDPTYGWRDILGTINPRSAGAGRPTLAVYRGGNVREFAFGAADDMDLNFHLPHDYAPGTDIYIHFHWSHNGTSISGSITADFYTTYSKGHDQQIFPAEKVVAFTYNTVDIATTPQYMHRIEEVQLSTSGGSATMLDTDDLEPDGVVLVHFDMMAIPSIGGGSPNEPFVHFIDIHYQSTGMATKQRAPDFYV